jgi:hypothetical protein
VVVPYTETRTTSGPRWLKASHDRSPAELTEEATSLITANDRAIRRALEETGIEFIDQNGWRSGDAVGARLNGGC